MIPVEVIQTPWHFTTVPDALDHWQTIIAGLAALLAALIAVLVTVRVERGKARREVDALRKSLGVELRQQIPRALAVYISFVLRRSDEPITARTVERLSRMPAPIIYSANAGKIGLLGAEAMDVMIVYDLLETARNGAAQLMAFGTPDDIISAPVVLKTADAFLKACKYARGVLPRLRTGNASREAKDEALIQRITERERADRAIRTATSVEAFEAIVACTLSSLGSVGYENATNERGERLIWLDHAVVARLRAMRGSGESYSDVILRLIETGWRVADA